MATALEPLSRTLAPRIPATPWRDPHSVSPAALAETIASLERQCAEQPDSAGLRTCLGMAYAMNFEVYKSMDALEQAVAAEPEHFWAQMKYAELLYRLRILPRAEIETLRALDLAGDPLEMAVARKQLQEIRRLMREGTQKPAWVKPLWTPLLGLVMFLVFLSVTHVWR
jgi:hypothetical protein